MSGSALTLSRWPVVGGLAAAIGRREREVRDTLWLLMAVVWVLLPHFLALPWWASVVIAGLLLWRGWITWTGRRLPSRWVLLSLMCLTGLGVYSQYRTIFGKDAGVAYVVLLLGLKILEMRARRDIFVVVYLCLFVMLTALFESQTIGAAAGMIVGTVLLVTALISANFSQREPGYLARLKLAGQMCLYAMPLMAVLFVLFPRVQGPLWGMPADAYGSRTGLSDSMSPGSFSNLTESTEIAFRVRFEGAVPPPGERYWRGPVFGYYNGYAWRSMEGRPHPAMPKLDIDKTSLTRYSVTMEPSNRPWLMALDIPSEAPAINDTTTLLRPDMQVVIQGLVRERTRYQISSYTRYRYGMDEDIIHLQDWLELPPSFNPRTLQFAADLRNTETDNAKLVQRVLRYIREQNFVYTLTPPKLGRNAVDEFLFDTRRGFCEHYAGAFVVLMRALDIPARVVTGYQGGEINPVDGYLEVQQREAHAWAEVWLEGQGWVRVDPTAAVSPDRIERGIGQTLGAQQGLIGGLVQSNGSWLRYASFNMDAITNAWNQWVLSYSPERQHGLLSGFGIPDIDWQSLTIALIVCFGAVLAFIGGQVVFRRPKIDPVVALYSRLCDRLGRSGVRRRPDEGPRDYLARVLPALPEAARTQAREAMALYERIRYIHSAESSSELIKQFKACIATLRL